MLLIIQCSTTGSRTSSVSAVPCFRKPLLIDVLKRTWVLLLLGAGSKGFQKGLGCVGELGFK